MIINNIIIIKKIGWVPFLILSVFCGTKININEAVAQPKHKILIISAITHNPVYAFVIGDFTSSYTKEALDIFRINIVIINAKMKDAKVTLNDFVINPPVLQIVTFLL